MKQFPNRVIFYGGQYGAYIGVLYACVTTTWFIFTVSQLSSYIQNNKLLETAHEGYLLAIQTTIA